MDRHPWMHSRLPPSAARQGCVWFGQSGRGMASWTSHLDAIPMKAAWQLRVQPPLGNRTSAACSSSHPIFRQGSTASSHAAYHAAMQPACRKVLRPRRRERWSDVFQDRKAGPEPWRLVLPPAVAQSFAPGNHLATGLSLLVCPGMDATELPLPARCSRLEPQCDTKLRYEQFLRCLRWRARRGIERC